MNQETVDTLRDLVLRADAMHRDLKKFMDAMTDDDEDAWHKHGHVLDLIQEASHRLSDAEDAADKILKEQG